ncbi:MAG TPA: hypothetical protein VGK70_02195 [Thermoanaerobaculia bacterium]|jgi:hypothetical protein
MARKEVLVGFTRDETRKRAPAARDDWTLVSIASSRRGLTPAQLQKSLYLLGEAFPNELGPDFYKFRSINAGHFSQDIYTDAESLAKKGLVLIEVSENDGWQHYSATTAGIIKARVLEDGLSPLVLQRLRRAVEWARNRSIDQLGRGRLDSPDSLWPSPDSRPVRPR